MIIKPFKAVRPAKEHASRVAALPYDVMSSDEARIVAANNPYSFLHIDKSEIDLPPEIDVYSPAVYQKARQNLYKMIDDKILVQDNEPNFYYYKLTINGRAQIGIVACVSVDEYISGDIKKHELTLEAKEQDRINHVDICNANTGPIFLAYRAREEIDKIISERISARAPEYDFVADDGIWHTVWVENDKTVCQRLAEIFKKVPALYIADGHHRNASAAKVALKRRENSAATCTDAEYNYYLAVLFPSNQLNIMSYNRLAKDLNGLSQDEFLAKVGENFSLSEYSGAGGYIPEQKLKFGMYLDGKWYALRLKAEISHSDFVASLDVSVLQNYLLNPILNIGDIRTSKRIDFVGGIRGLKELERRVNSGAAAVAFALFPTSIEELFTVSDQGKIMPPKSTWFEPKLRSGLFIHLL